MGHIGNIKALYRDLNSHLSHHQTSLPHSEETYRLLKMLFTQEEAELAVKLPLKPVKISRLAKRLNVPQGELQSRLEKMADRGLVLDVLREETGEKYYMLAPPVVGFMEMSFMRVRDDIPQKELAKLLHEVFHGRKEYAESLFTNGTNIGRTLVHEDTINGDYSEILPYERATEIITESAGGAVSNCYCRHIAAHNDTACDSPQEICTSLFKGADFVVRHGHGRRAGKEELLDILAEARERGLVQIADNVMHKPSYICHCCGCCCGQLTAINEHGLVNAVHTSNFIASIEEEKCTGCARCARRCPIGAIKMNPVKPYVPGRHKIAGKVDESICLGCGVCVAACKKEALSMHARPKRVLTPENTIERVMRMHLDRGTLQHLIFDDPENQTHRRLNAIIDAISALPKVKALLANKSLQSRYIHRLVNFAQKQAPGIDV